MQIFIRTTAGKVYAVDVESTMTIADLKEKIEAKHQVSMAELSIVFKGNILEDKTTIDEAGIKKEDLLNVVKAAEKGKKDERTLQLTNDGSNVITITFKETDSIEKIIIEGCEKFGGDPSKMYLFHKGQRLDNKSISIKDANIKDKDIVLISAFLRGGSL